MKGPAPRKTRERDVGGPDAQELVVAFGADGGVSWSLPSPLRFVERLAVEGDRLLLTSALGSGGCLDLRADALADALAGRVPAPLLLKPAPPG